MEVRPPDTNMGGEGRGDREGVKVAMMGRVAPSLGAAGTKSPAGLPAAGLSPALPCPAPAGQGTPF